VSALTRVLRGAFIGFGTVAEKGHAPGWRARAEVKIVAATDPSPSRREAFLAAFPDAGWRATPHDLLSGETLDFVDVCAPPGAHAKLIVQALDAGLHVLSEKPLVTRLDDARSVAAEAGRAERIVHTVHNWLEAPICQTISSLADQGAIGAVRSVQWWTLRTQPAVTVGPAGVANWRVDPSLAGGGILFDHGWHALYCVARWAGVPKTVSARLETRRHHQWPLEDTATIELETASGSSRIFLTWAADKRLNEIQIEGERGRIRVEGDTVVLATTEGEQRFPCPPALSEGSHHPDWFDRVVEDFLRAATGGGESNLAEAMLCARLIDAAQRSSAADGARLAFTA
jgi:predicted dehydrogenase